MTDLVDLYVQNPADDRVFTTLTFEHGVFVPPYRLVINERSVVTLGGDEFTPVAGELDLPQKDFTGRQDFNFTLDGVSLEVAEALDVAMSAAPEPIFITLSQWVASEPALAKSTLRAVLVDPQLNELRFSAGCAFSDLQNLKLHRKNYTLDDYPGLA